MLRLLTTYIFPNIIIVFGFLLYYYFLVYVFIYLLALCLCFFLLPQICGFEEISNKYRIRLVRKIGSFTNWLDARYKCVYLSDKFEGFDSSQMTDEELLENRESAYKYLVGNLWGVPIHWGRNIYASLFSRWINATVQLLYHMREIVQSHYVAYAVALIFLVCVHLLNML
jgi:hypothetical protein